MRSSGFGLGKKQTQGNEAKKVPPTNNDLTTILTMSQKTPDRSFFYKWQSEDGVQYHLTVVTNSMKGERKGWTVSAVDSSAIHEAQWRLVRDKDGKSQELFNMQSSDAYLVQSVVDEVLAEGKPIETTSFEDAQPAQSEPVPSAGGPPAYGGAPVASAGSGIEEQRGNLRSTPMRSLMENFITNRSTGHLICDTGTVTSEVFFTDGEPVHAKSIHSIYKDKDMTGDDVVLDLFTWPESDYKFRPGITSPTRTVRTSARDLLAGKVAPAGSDSHAAQQQPTRSDFASSGSSGSQDFNSGYATGPATSAYDSVYGSGADNSSSSSYGGAGNAESSFNSGYATGPGGGESSFNSGYATGPGAQAAAKPQLPGSAAAPIPLAARIKVDPDDFSNADDLIGETFSSLIEASGMLKYGMFLMLARTEFARHELSKAPFCIAAIGIETATGGGLSTEGIAKVQECFESAGQPLDTITAATNSRFFALFPHSSSAAAATSCKHFLNNIQTCNLENGIHGGSVKLTIGLCDIPRDGHDFETVMNHACKLRRAATNDRRIVMGA